MAIIPINSLPAIPTPVSGAAELAAELSGVTYKVTLDQIATYKYILGPSGSGAPYTDLQTMVTAMEADTLPQVGFVLPGVYTGNTTVTKPGVHLVGWTLGGVGTTLTEITAFDLNLTYTLSGGTGRVCAIQGITIDGVLTVDGTQATLLWVNDVEVKDATTTPCVLSNTSGNSALVGDKFSANMTAGTAPALVMSGAMSIDGEDIQVARVGGSGGTAIELSAGGNGVILRDSRVTGRIVATGGTKPVSITGTVSTVVTDGASGSCIDLSAGSGTVYLNGVGLLGQAGVNVVEVATAPADFTYSVSTVSFAGILDPTMGTPLNASAADMTLQGLFSNTGRNLLQYTAIEEDDECLRLVVDAAGFGGFKAIDLDYVTGAVAAGEDEEAILIQVNEVGSTGGRMVGLEVLATAEGSIEVDGLECGVNVHPVQQQSGVFGDADTILVLAVDETVDLSSGGAGNVAIFVADNDDITVGFSALFAEIEVILDTVASGAGVLPTFEYSTGVGTWATFAPVDGTDQFRQTGVIAWSLNDIPSWATGTGGEYLIRITRTRNSLSTTPIADLIKIAETTEFKWDKDGDVHINQLDLFDQDVTPVANRVLRVIDGLIRSATILDVEGRYISAASLEAHGADHILGGASEIDGDQLDIDFTPTNYTPSTAPAEATDVNHLTAHLAGLDDALAGASVVDTVSTTDATVTTLATIALADDTVYTFEVMISGRRTNAADRASYFRRCSVFREAAGVATFEGPVASGFTRESDSSWGVSLTVSGNNLLVQVIGAVGHDVNWKSSYRANSVG